MKRLIEKKDLQDQRLSDLKETAREISHKLGVNALFNDFTHDELIDFIVDSKQVYVETDEESEQE